MKQQAGPLLRTRLDRRCLPALSLNRRANPNLPGSSRNKKKNPHRKKRFKKAVEPASSRPPASGAHQSPDIGDDDGGRREEISSVVVGFALLARVASGWKVGRRWSRSLPGCLMGVHALAKKVS